ncbi:MAG TPA: type II toxin-antitoxin system VapC family toxin [Nocardioidaceae bacterium]|nr:type II toxin-antitoxin system VapC family toxin [Nocardioidaceae bacterium]
MRAILDTHVVLWAASTPERLGDSLHRIREWRCLMSAASVWELAIKQHLGRLDLGADVRSWAARAAAELHLERLAISDIHASGVEGLPDVHGDPFDRMLVAQAHAEDAVLLTADRTLLGYGDRVQLVG